MATTALARISGKVLSVPEPRRGHSKRTGEAYEIATANILVADQNVTVVQMPRKDDFNEYATLKSNPKGFEKDDVVDLLVEFSIFGSEVQARILSDYPAESLIDA